MFLTYGNTRSSIDSLTIRTGEGNVDNNAFDARQRRAIRNLEERWEELTFENDFVFGAVLQSDLDLCRRVLETVLDMPIDHVDLVEA